MNLPSFITLLLIFTFTVLTRAANILFFFGVSTYSHRIAVWPLVEILAAKGHNVTFVSSYRPKKLNTLVHEFCPQALIEFGKKSEIIPNPLKIREQGSSSVNWWVLPDFSYMLCEIFLKSPETKEWANKSHFDLVFVDSLFNDCGLGLAYKFKARHILYGTSTLTMWMYENYGIPVESSWIPDAQFFYPQQMSFLERLHTTINPIIWTLLRATYVFPRMETLIKNTLDLPDLPCLTEIERNVSLIFINSHYSEEFARSLPPLVVSVGGIHIYEKINHLPKEMESFLEKGDDDGFVYVSFGSSVNITQSPKRLHDVFFNTFKRFSNIKFIWKWNKPNPEIIPKNVLLDEWIPQQDILAHPKIRGFITHAGELGIQEAIYNSVPMLVLPCFAEQDYNAERMHRMELGIRLEIIGLTEEQLGNALADLLQDNSKYLQNMKKIPAIFKDRPMKPLETALWWTEYVLRHNDTSFLKPLGAQQNMFTRKLLDVWAFIFAVISILLAGIILIMKWLYFKTSAKKKAKTDNNKLKRS